jgi:hypothetical protein
MVGRDTLALVRVTWMVYGLLLAGCSFEHSHAVRTDGGDAPSENPQPLDSDKDGIPDSADNCPTVANMDQRDHDLDTLGDDCDRCPHLPNVGDPDADSDGVGDDCDPRPSLAGDTRVVWEGFYDSAAISNWTLMGNWSVSAGVLEQAGGAGEAAVTLPTTFQHPYIETSFQVSSLAGAGSLIGTCSSITAAQYYCCLMRNTGPVLNAVSSGAVSETQNAMWTGMFATGARVALVESETPTHACIAEQNATTVSKATALGATSGRVQLYMRDATASYEYLFIVEIGQ